VPRWDLTADDTPPSSKSLAKNLVEISVWILEFLEAAREYLPAKVGTLYINQRTGNGLEGQTTERR